MTTTSTAPVLVDDTVMGVDADGPVLRGSVCPSCDTTTFPAQGRCPRCSRTGTTPVDLPRAGSLWAFTVQHFAPKPPFRHLEPFEPFGVGYVDLGPVVVESRLTVADPDRLHVGLPMTLTLVPAYAENDGTLVHTYAFAPREDA